MTRLEALKWCWENLSDPNNNFRWEEVEDTIGGVYFEELRHMDFISRWFNWQENRTCVYMSWLGKAYCEEMFS